MKFISAHNNTLKFKIFQSLEIIQENPLKNNLDIKKFKPHNNHFRLRIGKYRLLFEVQMENELIVFYDADSRGNIY